MTIVDDEKRQVALQQESEVEESNLFNIIDLQRKRKNSSEIMAFGNALQVRASDLVINDRDSGGASTVIRDNVPN